MARIRLGGILFLLALGGNCLASHDGDPLGECTTTGVQRGLVIAVNFPESPGDLNNPTPTVQTLQDRYFGTSSALNDFWDEVSYGKTQLTGDVAGWYTLSHTGNQACGGGVRAEALERAAAEFDLTRYDRIFLHIKPPDFCSRRSFATVGCGVITTPQGQIRVSTSYNFTHNEQTVYHEAGHNLGLPHASYEDFGVDSVGPVGVAGSHGEYGDMFDVMGGYVSFVPVHHNSIYKHQLGFITDNEVVETNVSGTFTVEPVSAPITGRKTVKVLRGTYIRPNSATLEVAREYFWIETRSDTGYDANIDLRGPDGNGQPVGSIAASAFGGAIVRVKRDTKSNTLLVDTHPGTDTSHRDYLDAPMLAGETFTDPYTGISIHHDAYDALTGNVTVTVTVPDPDIDGDGLNAAREAALGTDVALPDTDGDGLTDFQEVCYDGDCDQADPGTLDTNPVQFDTDADQAPDGWEFFNGLDPLLADSSNDPDSDGLDNLAEYQNGTDPNLADTDADGLSDGDEVQVNGTDPLNRDTDADGMPDGWEVGNGLDPLATDSDQDPDGDGLLNIDEFAAQSDPLLADTDGDMLSDGDEVNLYGTSPVNVDTDGDRLNDYDEISVHATDPLSSIDSDGDAMPDDWENVRGTDAAVFDGRADLDGDLVDNAVEFLRDTDPDNSASAPVLRTMYVDASNTTGIEDGSAAHPYSTLTAAYLDSEAGDTVQLAAGNYTEVFATALPNVHVTGPNDGSGTATYTLTVGSWSNVEWGGFSNVDFDVAYTLIVQNSTNFELRNCSFTATQSLQMYGTHAGFRNVAFDGNGTVGVSGDAATDLTFEHVTIYGHGTGISVADGGSLTLGNSILLNTADLNLGAGVATADITYNLIGDGSLAGVNGNLAGDPQFADAVNADYHLLPGSVAIDSGDPLSAYDNEPENNGDRANMGRYGNTPEATAGQDSDADGLTDQNEWCYDGDCGTDNPYDATNNPSGGDLNRNAADTDGDNIDDAAELGYQSDPLDAAVIPFMNTGDFNGNAVLDMSDSLLCQQSVLQLRVPTANELVRADITGDGGLSVGDCVQIQRAALGM